MSRQRWIDAFFRERLERRAFPVEEGEFDSIRSLIEQRNASVPSLRGGRISKWWLTALIPAAAVLWWAIASDTGSPKTSEATLPEYQLQDNATVGVEQVEVVVPNLFGSSAEPAADGSNGGKTGDGRSVTAAAEDHVGPTLDVGHVAGAQEEPSPRKPATSRTASMFNATAVARGSSFGTTAVAEDDAHPAGPEVGTRSVNADERATRQRSGEPGVSSSQSDLNDALVFADHTVQEQAGEGSAIEGTKRTVAANEHGTTGSRPEEAGPDRSTAMRKEDDGTRTQPFGSGVPEDGQVAMVVQAGQRHGTDASLDTVVRPEQRSSTSAATEAMDAERTSEGLIQAMGYRGSVDMMAPRLSFKAQQSPPEPVQREIPVIKRFATGELHGFGAPLAVRARWGDRRAEVQNGLLLGVEYRVRTKRFSWATGIHYGSYSVRADQGATDVSLAFVELPLLASYKLGRGRFGILAQGGISIDLLFNAKGRYAVAADASRAGFPEDAFQTTNLSWSFRPQAIYHISERLSCMAGPLWKMQLVSMANDGPLKGARILSSGVSFGLAWRLERTTY